MSSDRGFIQDRRAALYAAAMAIASAVILFALHSHRFVATNDEGILLEAAQRVVAGQAPYTDFFGYMSPGSYWLQALVFQICGISIWAGRVSSILGLSLQCGLVLWLVSRLATLRAAVVTAMLFWGFQIGDPAFLTAQHRWDSATFVLAAVCAGLEAQKRASVNWALATGCLLGAAAWCTPSMVFVILVVAVWFLWLRDWRQLVAMGSGVLAVSVLATGLLMMEGSFGAFVQQMLWLQRNYSAVNSMPYGSVIGGWGRLFEGVTGPALGLTAIAVFLLALPAILPVVGALGWAFLFRSATRENKRVVALMLLASVALMGTTFPRADIMHLAFVAALPAALAGAGVSRLFPERAAGLTATAFALGALLFASNPLRAWIASERVPSPVGPLLSEAPQSEALRQILTRVNPADSLFVHPYMPVLYFLTQARNVSRYAFLAPGMMTAVEEQELLTSVRADPPKWVLYQPTSRAEFLRIFPNATELNHRFPLIDEWVDANYEAAAEPEVRFAGYRLLVRRNTQ